MPGDQFPLIMFFWICIATFFVAAVIYFRQKHSRFSRHGVKCLSPAPLLGTNTKMALRLEHYTDHFMRIYTAFPNERFVGSFVFSSPVAVIRDLDLVKNILVKDFEHFVDHRIKLITFFEENIVSLKGQDWKEMRSTLSPAFTSSKIRLMVPFMLEVGDQMICSLNKKMSDSGVNYMDINVKDLTTRYANDVIATCAFGLNVNSHKEENNVFYTMTKTATNFSFMQLILFLLSDSTASILMKLGIAKMPDSMKNFYKSLVLDTMKDRESKHVIRPDMIHLLMEAKKGKLTHEDKTKDVGAGYATVEESSMGKKEVTRIWTDDELIAQAMIFLLGGFETVSSTMTLSLHELALNPDVQEKLYQEIKEHNAKNRGKIDFESIQKMEYLDMVVSEVLRIWPAAPVLDRLCVKDYNLGKPNDKATEDYIVRKGEGIEIPLWGLHHDPELYPDPLKFDPERFSEENRHKIKPFSYMPFGQGPRNCIGSRFALCEVKVMLYQLLLNMEVSVNSKTQLTRELDTKYFNLRLKGGHWARLLARK